MAARLKTSIRRFKPIQMVLRKEYSNQGQQVERFKYTCNSPNLSTAQRQFYEDNGYIIFKKLVHEEKLEKYRNRFESICRGEVTVPQMLKMKDISIDNPEFIPGEKAIIKIHDFFLDDELFDYCKLPQLLDYAEAIVGSNIQVINTMMINKPPDPDKKRSRHPLHQDLYYYPIRPAEKIVGVWTAMGEVNRDNGCLAVLPGTHKGPLLPHVYPQWEGRVNKLYLGVRDYNPERALTYLEMSIGDTVFFHPLLIHGSGNNGTHRFRKAISCHYSSTDVVYETDDVQKDGTKEILKMYAAKQEERTAKITLEDIWKQKSRVVRGH